MRFERANSDDVHLFDNGPLGALSDDGPLGALATRLGRLLRDESADGGVLGDGASGDDGAIPTADELWHTTLLGVAAFIVGCAVFWCCIQPLIVTCRRQRGFDAGDQLL